MQSMNQIQIKVDASFRLLRILWFAILISIALLLFLCLFVVSTTFEKKSVAALALTGFSLVPTAASFLFKRSILTNATEKRALAIAQSAYIMAFAMCEASALIGVLNCFTNGSSYYYFSFAIAGVGMLLNFPKRDDLLAACGTPQI